jgi:hypothetical protein
MRLYDLADGRLRRFEFPPDRDVSIRPSYLTATEFLIRTSGLGLREPPPTLWRVDITALPYEE